MNSIKLLSVSQRHERKFNSLLREHAISTGIKNNPNEIITNLTGDTLTQEEESILRFGLKHNLATRPNESQIIATAESIWEQLQRQNALPDSFIKQLKIKNSIKALACNFLNFDDKRLSVDNKRIKLLKHLHERYAILKPDKGNGVVLIKKDDYKICMTTLFSDTTKFKTVSIDNTLTQLTTLQNYLRKIYNRNEITKDQYDNIRPVSTKPARAHGLPKIHKTFDSLPSSRPIIDTTGTAYQPVAKYLNKLLNPITTNEFTVKDSFDAVTHINNIPRNLFNDGYRFVFFDVTSLFTNIPLKKTVNIILKRIYKNNLISTTLKKRTLKKLILDSCTKTIFSLNGKLYKQIDGVSMGSPLGPTLANIIMTEFEDIIIKPPINSGTIKFDKRYVDDTLILTKPSDIPYIFAKFNSFHPSIQFTIDDFNDNDIHFLDIQIHSSGTSVYRKPTHTGQYQHISSFSPWSRKVAWLRALVNRAYKICSTETLLKDELQHIQNFISWNGFPRKLSLKSNRTIQTTRTNTY